MPFQVAKEYREEALLWRRKYLRSTYEADNLREEVLREEDKKCEAIEEARLMREALTTIRRRVKTTTGLALSGKRARGVWSSL